MKKDIADIWIAALRSGRFKQGFGRLKQFSGANHEASHCCLGVLCELAIESGLAIDVIESNNFMKTVYFDNKAHYLPPSVKEWAGIKTEDEYSDESPIIGIDSEPYELIAMNDFEKVSFDKIADMIEKGWHTL